MGEILAVVITMGARELVCGEREREERRRGEKQVSGTETFVKMWYINVRCDRHFFKHRSYERVDTALFRNLMTSDDAIDECTQRTYVHISYLYKVQGT